MEWIRPVVSAITLVLLTTSTAFADPSALENNMRASLATIRSSDDMPGPAFVGPSFNGPGSAQVSGSRVNPAMAALHRLSSLTGGHSVSIGINSESQILGVANGRSVVQRWTDFRISIGLLTQR
jgi:hypothetical protein